MMAWEHKKNITDWYTGKCGFLTGFYLYQTEKESMIKLMTLNKALEHLHLVGKYNDFTDNGMPTVGAVKKLTKTSVTRKEIDEAWFQLYGWSTCRENPKKERSGEEKKWTPKVLLDKKWFSGIIEISSVGRLL